MLKRVVLTLVLCITLTALALAAFGQDSPPPPGAGGPPLPGMGMGRPGMGMPMPPPCVVSALRVVNARSMPMLEQQLKLADDQKAKVLDYLTKADEGLKSKIDAQRKAGEAFAMALAKAGSSEATLTAAGTAAMNAESAVLNDKIKTLIGLRAMLTSEQNAELDKMLSMVTSSYRPREPHGRPGGPGMPPPPGPAPAPPAPGPGQ